jgi:hypothetical protein
MPITNESLEIPVSHEVNYKRCKKLFYMLRDKPVETMQNLMLMTEKFAMNRIVMGILHRNGSLNFVIAVHSCKLRRAG